MSVDKLSPPSHEGARPSALMIGHCNQCGENHYYPRPFCPFCMSADTTALESAGAGVVYSYTVLPRAPEFKVVAFITLNEGPTLLSAVVGCEPADVAVGLPVSAGFQELDSGNVPVFTLNRQDRQVV